MPTIPDQLAAAIQHHQAGRLPEAEQGYRRILAADPNYAAAWHLLGVIAHQTGKHELAVSTIQRAISLAEDRAIFHSNLGEAYRALRQTPTAITCYQRAVQLDPGIAGFHYNLANALKDEGRFTEAVAAYQQALRLKPNYPEACNNLGNTWKALGKSRDAIQCYQRATQMKPDFVEARNNLDRALADHQRVAGEVAGTKDAESYFRLGNVAREQQRFADAIAWYRHALAVKPGYVEAWNNLGATLKDLGRLDEAAACYRDAIQYKPDYAEAHSNLGGIFWERGDVDQAVACFRRALDLKPDYDEALHNLGVVLKDRGEVEEAIACNRRALELRPSFAVCHGNLAYLLGFCPGFDAQAICEELRRWNDRHAAPLAKTIQPHANDRSADRRLRIGYISPDFRVHCQAFFTVPLLSSHDHQNFEIFCYADVARPDATTARLRAWADVWRDIVGLSDEQITQLVRQDQIDILVDLTMHMNDNHLLVFARKPAPVQICWLAYPGSTGLTAIDYRLTDPYLDPPGLNDQDASDHYYSEESLRLPDTFWCYDPLTSEPAVNPLPATDACHITFGCLNNFCKVNAEVLKLWASVLKLVDRSRIVILSVAGSHRQHTLDLLEQEGVCARSRDLRRLPTSPAVFETLPPHRHRARHVPIQRAHHKPRFALDGGAGRYTCWANRGRPGRPEPTHESRPAGVDRSVA